METIYLTKEEKEIFDSLPAGSKNRWLDRVQRETIDAYETPEELERRMIGARYERFPQVRRIVDDMIHASAEGKSINDVSVEDFPDEAVPTFLYGIGALGMSAIIKAQLQEVRLNDALLETIGALSRSRHLVLKSNAMLVA